jgi:hypothetical protein
LGCKMKQLEGSKAQNWKSFFFVFLSALRQCLWWKFEKISKILTFLQKCQNFDASKSVPKFQNYNEFQHSLRRVIWKVSLRRLSQNLKRKCPEEIPH